MKPKKLSKKEIKELKKQFPKLEEKASFVDIVIMITLLVGLAGALYYLYLTLTYQV